MLAVLTALIAGNAPATGVGDFGQFHAGVNLVTGVAVVGLVLNLLPLLQLRRQQFQP